MNNIKNLTILGFLFLGTKLSQKLVAEGLNCNFYLKYM